LHIQEDKTLNASSTIAFLEKFEEVYPTKTKIHLFCDNASCLIPENYGLYYEDNNKWRKSLWEKYYM
jgi:hypothetical protein